MNIRKGNVILTNFSDWFKLRSSSSQRIMIHIASGSCSGRSRRGDVGLDEEKILGLGKLE